MANGERMAMMERKINNMEDAAHRFHRYDKTD